MGYFLSEKNIIQNVSNTEVSVYVGGLNVLTELKENMDINK